MVYHTAVRRRILVAPSLTFRGTLASVSISGKCVVFLRAFWSEVANTYMYLMIKSANQTRDFSLLNTRVTERDIPLLAIFPGELKWVLGMSMTAGCFWKVPISGTGCIYAWKYIVWYRI